MALDSVASVKPPYRRAPPSNIIIPTKPFEFRPQSRLPSDPQYSPRSIQVISSLIDSLSVIPNAEQEAGRVITVGNRTHPHSLLHEIPHSPRSPNADELDRELHDPSAADDDSNGDVAAAPVIRYARRPPIISRKSSKTRLFSFTMSEPGLAARASFQSLRSHTESDSVGIPSIERLRESNTSSNFSIRNDMSALGRKPTVESMREQATTRPTPPKRISSDRHRKAESFYSTGQETENSSPRRSLSIDGHSSGRASQDSLTAESPTAIALSRLSRGDSGSHLIPSRRSSLRRSVRGLSDTTHDPAGRKLKELNIDSELIEGDNSTVRRIRELQEAREKRQKEWRNEARKSERAAKRHTIATAKLPRRSSPYANSRLSVTEVVVESPEMESLPAESPPVLSARITAADLAGMPALVPVAPDEEAHSPYKGTSPMLSSSAARSRDNSTYQATPTQIKRSSTSPSIRQEPPLNELKTISDEVDGFLGAPRFTQRIRHPRTGRTIAFSEVGDPDGFVVLCCVGMGLTRYLTAFYDELARTLRLRLITPDRPGVGESSAMPEGSFTPLNWVDDVAVICSSLGVTRFSILAHSAGAIYALATALKMPQYVRGRIHLLAPWIPPSQMPKGAVVGSDSQPIANLPFSHKLLSVLPAQFLKVANSRFLTATSASIDVKPPKPKKNKTWENFEVSLDYPFDDITTDNPFSSPVPDMEPERPKTGTPNRARSLSCYQANNESQGVSPAQVTTPRPISRRQMQNSMKQQGATASPMSPRLSPEARQALYNQTLTHRIWALATQNANPAIDLVVCLERRKPISFRYPDVTRSVVIHHGAKDTRVPLDNVRWLQSVMKRCELRVLDGEGHGLMASASAMATVLGEIAKEWEEWEKIAKGKDRRKKSDSPAPRTRGRV
ncbi:hypothetical protein EDD36DRAFT_146657 [Exophiala viscosa]|uniref:AB hydrolase-1 domain-containing protein n=1 Tax=Exophiala viscosa TaxID=2486360 RepID=A0AAN6E482_9EURO|nr:hypothetical protein EDD36DRAFT_146657 [Exophiala viscosa]